MSDFFLADDLSGALDAAAAFHHAGRRVTIALAADAWPGGAGNDVVGFTTETRNARPEIAAAAVATAIAHGRRLGARLVYKKIDSTLRGPVAAELAALAAAMPEARILFTPANPRVGRTVRDGVLLVRGVPVAQTEFARDPVSPVNESAIRRLLGDAASERVVIADAETEEDLARAVARMDAAGDAWVGVGSGALARPVAARGSGDGRQGTGDRGRVTEDGRTASGSPAPRLRSPVLGSPSSVPCLLICGSAHPGNHEQAAALARERGVPVHELRLDAPAAAIAFARTGVAAHGGATLLIEQRRGDSAVVVGTIARTAAAILEETRARRVFVTGGETAFALCRALRVAALTFCTEIEAGLSISRADSGGTSILFAIKPGGFGDPQTWVRAWDALAAT